MKFINADKLHRKSGGVGYDCSQPSTLSPNQGPLPEKIPEWRNQ
jgi:hypothetical protein